MTRTRTNPNLPPIPIQLLWGKRSSFFPTQADVRIWNNIILASCPWGPDTAYGLSCDASVLVFFQIWLFASHIDKLPITGDLSRGNPMSSYNIWQDRNFSWHIAKSTPPDPPRSKRAGPYLTTLTKITPEKAHFCGWMTLTFDFWPLTLLHRKSSNSPNTYHYAKCGGPRSNGFTILRLWHPEIYKTFKFKNAILEIAFWARPI